jgi:hypothetical protein
MRHPQRGRVWDCEGEERDSKNVCTAIEVCTVNTVAILYLKYEGEY